MSLKTWVRYDFGDFRLDPRERVLRSGDTVVAIAPKAFDALLLLVENAGALVERGSLRERLWPGQIVEDATIARVIADIRKALNDPGEERRYIETVPKFGYRFLAAVHRQEQAPAEEPALAAEPPLPPAQAPSRIHGWQWTAAAVVAMVAGGIAAGGWALKRAPRVDSVLITPFEAIGQPADIGILRLGLQESLAMELSSLSHLAVLKSAELPDDLAELGRRHRAAFVLTGSVEPVAGRIHVNARLLRSANGEAVWTHAFDEAMDDLFKVQSRLASLTVAEVLPLLPPDERGVMERRHTANGAAYRYYLLGRYYWNQRDSDGYRQAVEMFQKAAQADPNYALAYVGLADSYLLDPSPEADQGAKARSAAQAALETAVRLDPALGEAHATLAMIAGSYQFDWAKAEQELQTAIRLSPNYVTAHHWYAEFLTMMGNFEQSEAEFEVTRDLDPASAPVLTDVAQLQMFERKYEQSMRTLDEVLRLHPTFYLAHERKGYALMLMRRPSEAMAEFETADRAANRTTGPWLKAWVAAVAGERTEALRLANLADARGENPMTLAVVWAELGEMDRGMDCLERAYEHRSAGMVSLKVNPIFDPLRKSKRFSALRRRMNLD